MAVQPEQAVRRAARTEKVRLGQILIQQKRITEEQLNAALEEQKQVGRRLGRVLIASLPRSTSRKPLPASSTGLSSS